MIQRNWYSLRSLHALVESREGLKKILPVELECVFGHLCLFYTMHVQHILTKSDSIYLYLAIHLIIQL
jgi:hypothetical protein